MTTEETKHRQEAASRLGREEDLSRIEKALEAAADILRDFPSGATPAVQKNEREIVTAADHAINQQLWKLLPRGGEGWLSEESVDDRTRLTKRRVWIVDPLDGTNEFVAGIPEWCVSVGLVEDGRAVAGGILNPATGELFLGSLETGVTLNGQRAFVRGSRRLEEMLVLASRSEVSRGEWACFREAPFQVQATGSVAYKLAQVAAGLADATWTFRPKHEWDVAAGVALATAAGCVVNILDEGEPVFNRANPYWKGLLAFTAASEELLLSYLKNTKLVAASSIRFSGKRRECS